MYGVRGERRLTEFEIPELPGYEESRPVRIGNAASCQFQLDVYGEVVQALYEARRLGLPEAAGARGRRAISPSSSSRRGSFPTTASGKCAEADVTSFTRR